MLGTGRRGAFRVALAAVVSATALLMVGASLQHVQAVDRGQAGATAIPTAQPVADTPAPPEPTPAPTPAPRALPSLDALGAQIASLAQAQGATVSVSLIELAGTQPRSWSAAGDSSMVAASTYKLPLLMAEAQGIAAGTIHSTDVLCYIDADWEDGWFSDYVDGLCFSRAELDKRAGTYSDNTAAHILVRYMGGTDKLNQYARAHGATESQFYDPNQTTANDLARLLANEQAGAAGGAGAQQYLYPLLTHTQYESGVPAGVPATATVVHKIGDLDQSVNDAAIVLNGPQGAYVLVVMVDMAESDGWSLISQISNQVSQLEAAR